jgi:alkanesulfonate monooxygenase SsuD/methylene tetrahydromethanopterin reductase-like flavin-dependent oxidoreductase (luciferase family)
MLTIAKVPGLSLYPGSVRHWFEDLTPAEMISVARELEAIGIDYLTVSEHLALDKEFAKTLGARWAHSLTASGILLGATTRVKVVCLVILPFHPPIELAKAIATLDMMSGGRLIPVFLVGYHPAEFATLGVPYQARGAIMDEHLEAMHELWRSDDPRYEGEHVRFADIVAEPRPGDSLELWFGGHTKVALRRAARWGSGWLPWATTRSRLPGMLQVLREHGAFDDRRSRFHLSMPLFEGENHPDTHQVIKPPQVSMDPEVILHEAQLIAGLGADLTSLDQLVEIGPFAGQPGGPPPVTGLADYRRRLAWLGETVLPGLREITAAPLT